MFFDLARWYSKTDKVVFVVYVPGFVLNRLCMHVIPPDPHRNILATETMAQWLRVCTVLHRTPDLFQAPMSGSPQLPITTASWDSTPSSGFFGHCTQT